MMTASLNKKNVDQRNHCLIDMLVAAKTNLKRTLPSPGWTLNADTWWQWPQALGDHNIVAGKIPSRVWLVSNLSMA